MTKQQKVPIKIPKEYSKDEREAIALDIVEFIRERTREKGLDKDNKKMPKYSKGYEKSLDFRVAGKSKKVDLTLTGDMLDLLDVIKTAKGKIEVGYQESDPINGKVEGNRLGTYGNKTPTGKARDFLGIAPKDLDAILKKYPLDDARERITRALSVLSASEKAAESTLENLEDAIERLED